MLIHNNLRSWCLQTNVDVDIIIPDLPQNISAKDYFRADKKFPVLYLLHGTWGGYNDFVRRTSIDLYAKECGIMIVMPNALNSEYSNWSEFMLGYNMFDFVTEELMPMIQNFFPGSARREDNYIGGLSMGSMGAIKYAVNHPDKFGGCLCMSGVPIDTRKRYEEGTLSERTLNNIKHAGGIEKYLDSYENVWEKCRDIARMEDAPDFYICCGTKDFLYPDHLKFKEYAQEIGFPATFHDAEDYYHEFRFWDMELEKALSHFGLSTGVRNITVPDDFDKVDKSLL